CQHTCLSLPYTYSIYSHTHTCTHIYLHIQTYTHMHKETHTDTHSHSHTHTHTHTHTHPLNDIMSGLQSDTNANAFSDRSNKGQKYFVLCEILGGQTQGKHLTVPLLGQ